MAPILNIDRKSGVSLHRQIAAFLRGQIQSGVLPPAAKLPPSRRLAAELGVSRNTVVTAYEELAAEGLLCGRIGSATRVAGQRRVIRMPDPRAVLRAAHYPLQSLRFRDPDGNVLSVVRTV